MSALLHNKVTKSLRVLLAEDEDIYQKIIESYVNSLDLELTIVENGRQCITKAEEQNYDIILMDIIMPEINGYEATREIREKGIKTPIIAVTSNTWAEDEITSIKTGMNDFLAKPFNAKKLAGKIAYWTRQKGLIA